MKKTTLTFAFMVMFTLYAVASSQKDASKIIIPKLSAGETPPSKGNDISQSDRTTLEPPKPVSSSIGVTNTTPSVAPPKPKPKGLYNDGTYVGSVADAYYGNVQVEATIKDGRLANVRFIQYPNDRGTSIEINSQAMPYLMTEAIAAQSAQVDIVSGATLTSEAFRSSLANALTKARATA